MGTDIHLFVEYRENKKYDTWTNLGREFCLERNYYVFGLLAGLRGGEQIFKTRGLPENISWDVEDSDSLEIEESDTDCSGKITRAKAEKWVANGTSKYVGKAKVPHRVTHPDWHSHSWLSCSEFRSVIDKYESEFLLKEAAEGHDIKLYLKEYYMVLGLLEKIEQLGYESRIVFWFDN